MHGLEGGGMDYPHIPVGSRLNAYLGVGRPTGAPMGNNGGGGGGGIGAGNMHNQSPVRTGMSQLNANSPAFVPQFSQLRIQNPQQAHHLPPQQHSPHMQPMHGARGMHLHENGAPGGYGGNNAGGGHDFMGEQRGGTTYYSSDYGGISNHHSQMSHGSSPYNDALSPTDTVSADTHTLVGLDGAFSYTQAPPHIGKFRPRVASGNPNVSQFVTHDIKKDLMDRQLAWKARPAEGMYNDLPKSVEHLRELILLDSGRDSKNASPSTLQQTTYKAVSLRDNIPIVMRRVHGYRVQSTKQLQPGEAWKKVICGHVVQLREIFTTRAFGDNSLIFVYDYHPTALTLKHKHCGKNAGGMVDIASGMRIGGHMSMGGMNGQGVMETVLWNYIIQISNALKTIHGCGLAVRNLDVNTVLCHGTTGDKILVNRCGMLDIVQPDHTQMQTLQQDDWAALGRLVLCLATGSVTAARNDQMKISMHTVSAHYSNDMRIVLNILLNAPQKRVSFADIMPAVGARFFQYIELIQTRADIVENELSRELENGRLIRLLCKISTVVERPEFNHDRQWSETGDRYAMNEMGRPWIDMAHIVTSLNKLDAGVQERIELVSRDQDSVIICSYADIRRCVDSSFAELTSVVPGIGAGMGGPRR